LAIGAQHKLGDWFRICCKVPGHTFRIYIFNTFRIYIFNRFSHLYIQQIFAFIYSTECSCWIWICS
jgi:hypothetical protein